MELRLLDENIHRVKAVITEWLGRKAGRKREMESLVHWLACYSILLRWSAQGEGL